AVSEFGDGRGLARLFPLARWVGAVLNLDQQLAGTLPRCLNLKKGAATESEAPRNVAGPVLDDKRLLSRRLHAHTEARQVIIPVNGIGRGLLERLDALFGDLHLASLRCRSSDAALAG